MHYFTPFTPLLLSLLPLLTTANPLPQQPEPTQPNGTIQPNDQPSTHYASFRVIANGLPKAPCNGTEIALWDAAIPINPDYCYATPGDHNITCVQRRTTPLSQEAAPFGGPGVEDNGTLLDIAPMDVNILGYEGGDQCGGMGVMGSNADNLQWTWNRRRHNITGIQIQSGGL